MGTSLTVQNSSVVVPEDLILKGQFLLDEKM